MSDYPEHDKMALVKDQSQAIGQFLDLAPYDLGEYVPCANWHLDEGHCSAGAHFTPASKSIVQILADYFDIDLTKIESEKRAMLASIKETPHV